MQGQMTSFNFLETSPYLLFGNSVIKWKVEKIYPAQWKFMGMTFLL